MLRSVCRVHFFVVCILVVCSFDHSHKVTINIGKKKPPNDKMLCINRKIDKPHYVCSSLYFYCCYCCCCLAKGSASASASAQACTPPIYLRKMSLFFLLFKLQAIYFRLLIAKAQQFSFFFFC